MNWDDVRLFLAVARHGGLAGAAQATGRSPATLGRRMIAFEATVGAELFERRARGYALTEAGEALLAHATDLEAQAEGLTTLFGTRHTPLVKVSAGAWMTLALAARADQLVEDDAVALRFIAADHVLDIAHRETVIGLRNQRPESPALACRRVGTVRFAAYAADRAVKRWARVLGQTPSARFSREQPGAAIEVTHPRNALDLALAGAARAVLPTFIGDAREGLQRVSPLLGPLQHEQWLVTHPTTRFEPAVRAVIDRLYAVLATVHSR